MQQTILVIDDEPDIRQTVKDILEDEHYVVIVAENGNAAKELLKTKVPDLILLDIWMPDIDGITLLKQMKTEMDIDSPVIMMSGHGTVETAVEATRLGAVDYIEKPLSISKLLITMEKALIAGNRQVNLASESKPIRRPIELIGKSQMIDNLRKQLSRVAKFDTPVLLIGEPGCGKSYNAEYIHSLSDQLQGPFISAKTRLFTAQHAITHFIGKTTKGYTDIGFLEQANGGTLYINDIAHLDIETQKSLLTALSSQVFYRDNSTQSIPIKIRIIAGTSTDLSQEVRAGRFYQGLYHYLHALPLNIPPLRTHREDISELLRYYADFFVEHEDIPYRSFSVAAQNRLRNHQWPGNIQELENLVRRLLIMGNTPEVSQNDVEAALKDQYDCLTPNNMTDFNLPLRQAREKFEKAYLEFHLKQTRGSVGKVAQLAGMERTNLYRKLRALGIDAKELSKER